MSFSNVKNISLFTKANIFLYYLVVAILLFSLTFGFVLVGKKKSFADPQNTKQENTINGVEYYPNPKAAEDAPSILESLNNNANIGVVQSTFDAQISKKIFGESTKIFEYLNYSDMLLAVENNKLDYCCITVSIASSATKDYPDIKCTKEMFTSANNGVAFSKDKFNQNLYNQVNEFIANSKADGYLDSLKNKWEDASDISQVKKEQRTFSDSSPVIEVATCSQLQPYVLLVDGELTGMDIEFFEKFCEEYGYRPHFTDYTFDGMILAMSSGKAELGVACICITDERKQAMYFSEPYNSEKVGYYYKDNSSFESKGVFASIGESIDKLGDSFYKTFIVEDRWLDLLSGLGVTLIITVAAIFFGMIFGIIVSILRTTKIKWLNKIINAYISIFQGTPILVMLLIFYYIFFGKTNIDGIVVAIIVFSLNGAAYFCEAITSGLQSVDVGQKEAALALGYSPRKAFTDYIFPQAAKIFIPTCRGVAISLLKDTSIVGYIAIADLTKVGDIIRSRTFEAFFPLITVAIIYFVLAFLIRKLFEYINSKI